MSDPNEYVFKNNDGRKRKICDKNIHKAMRITFNIYQKIKLFVTVQQKTHVDWNLQIIHGYHFLINFIQTL